MDFQLHRQTARRWDGGGGEKEPLLMKIHPPAIPPALNLSCVRACIDGAEILRGCVRVRGREEKERRVQPPMDEAASSCMRASTDVGGGEEEEDGTTGTWFREGVGEKRGGEEREASRGSHQSKGEKGRGELVCAYEMGKKLGNREGDRQTNLFCFCSFLSSVPTMY